MKLTNKAKEELNDIFFNLKKTKDWLKSNDVEVCTRTLPNATSFYNKENIGITPINKSIGSKLQYMENAIERLSHFIVDNTNRTTN